MIKLLRGSKWYWFLPGIGLLHIDQYFDWLTSSRSHAFGRIFLLVANVYVTAKVITAMLFKFIWLWVVGIST